MQNSALFDLAFRRNTWLAERQTTIAANIANANTPGYKSKDVAPFEKAMAEALPMTVTNPAHIIPAGMMGRSAETEDVNGEEKVHSGNDVDLEKEFLKSGDVMRNYAMNSQIIKAFHRMVLAAAKV